MTAILIIIQVGIAAYLFVWIITRFWRRIQTLMIIAAPLLLKPSWRCAVKEGDI
jgi:hypothetical protein